jgi:hypothetical protein
VSGALLSAQMVLAFVEPIAASPARFSLWTLDRPQP